MNNKQALETHPQEMKAVLEPTRYQLYQFQRKVSKPALNSARDYFAEMPEACYGFNDCHPFLRFELKE